MWVSVTCEKSRDLCSNVPLARYKLGRDIQGAKCNTERQDK